MHSTAPTLLHLKGTLQTYNVLVLTKMWHYVCIGVQHVLKTLSALRWLVVPILPLWNNVLARQTTMDSLHGSEKQTVLAEHGVHHQTQAGFRLPVPVHQNHLAAKPQQITGQKLAVQIKAVKKRTPELMSALTPTVSQFRVRGL
jgi:hypothetical protein